MNGYRLRVGGGSANAAGSFFGELCGFVGATQAGPLRFHRQGGRAGIRVGDAHGQTAPLESAGCGSRDARCGARSARGARDRLRGGGGLHRFCWNWGGRGAVPGDAGRLHRVALGDRSSTGSLRCACVLGLRGRRPGSLCGVDPRRNRPARGLRSGRSAWRDVGPAEPS